MHGHNRIPWTAWGLALVSTALLGCTIPLPEQQPGEKSVSENLGSHFDEAQTGNVRGQVLWSGELPQAKPFAKVSRAEANGRSAWPNPHAPTIDPRTSGVKDAVVFLRGVDPRQARPWDWPPVRVVQKGLQLHVQQGGTSAAVGFVRQGDPVETVSEDHCIHSLHADGAAFLTLSFPEPGQPRIRHLRDRGWVELSSGAGFYWMRAHLLVSDHPYCARTDDQGRFILSQVPPGRYEAVAWLPNWEELRHERDCETGLIARCYFLQPWEETATVSVKPQGVCEVAFQLGKPAASPPSRTGG